MYRKFVSSSRLVAALIMLHLATSQAATFSYHGSLQDSGKPAEGSYDLELTLYTAASGGKAIGGPLLLHGVPVSAGSFSTQADFGPLSNIAGTPWLAVKVRPAGGGDFTALAARSPVSAEATASVCPGAWTLNGNAGTTPGTGVGQNYMGTSDRQPLVLAVNGAQTALFTPAPAPATDYADAVSVALGSPHNVASGIGAVVGGGGTQSLSSCGSSGTGSCINQASGFFSTVAGGRGNDASNFFSTISGGYSNSAPYASATIGGGDLNSAFGDWATISGGSNNFIGGYYATIPGGHQNDAGGDNSFAAGSNAVVRDSASAGNGQTCSQGTNCGDYGTFVWSDGNFSSGVPTPFTSTGPRQFLIHAQGGVAINAPPISNAVELTIAASPNGSDTANLFLRQASNEAGILLRSASATSTANNDAVFSIDQYNGSTGARVLTVAANGDFTVTAAAFKPLGGAWSATSDARLKRDVRTLDGALDRVLQLRGVTFEYANPDSYQLPAGRHTGFIAQEVQQIFPDWIGSTADGYLTVGPNGFEALTVEALRELRAEKDAEIAALQRNLEEAGERNAAMQNRLDDLAAEVHRLAVSRER
jgi:hypothetical protein